MEHRKDEPITPQQTTLLKVFDALLQSDELLIAVDFIFLVQIMASFVDYSRGSILCALTPSVDNTPASPDNMDLAHAPDLKLAPTLNALILATQCCLSISLQEAESDPSSQTFSEHFKSEAGLIENLVGQHLAVQQPPQKTRDSCVAVSCYQTS